MGIGFWVFMVLIGGAVVFHIGRILFLFLPLFYWGIKAITGRSKRSDSV
ncbi:MAG: hypothetical protein AAB267_09775 [Candidatus Desantisbacteria bacterium]